MNLITMGKSKPIAYEIGENNCWNCTSHSGDTDGYPRKRFGEGSVYFKIVTWQYIQEHGEIPKGMVLRHLCGNVRCINPNHIVLGTHLQNMNDRYAHGTMPLGEKSVKATVTDAEAKEIYVDLTTSTRDLADKYSTSTGVIQSIKSRKAWKHISEDYPIEFQKEVRSKMKHCGEKVCFAKLTEVQVKEIYLSPLRASQLSVQYKVGKNTIWRIKNNRFWKDSLGKLDSDTHEQAQHNHFMSTRGESRYNAKATSEIAKQIFMDKSHTSKELAAIHGVSKTLVYNIKHGIAWKHVTSALAMLLIFMVGFAQPPGHVKHGKDKIEVQPPGQLKKEYSLTEVYPKMNLEFKSNNGQQKHKPQKHYVYKDDSVSIFVTKGNGNAFGTYQNKNRGTYNFKGDDLIEQEPLIFDCHTPQTSEQGNQQLPELVAAKCAKMYTEWDYDFYLTAGSMQAAMDQVEGILAQSQYLFDNDTLPLSFHEVFIWNTADPYTGTSSISNLTLFKTNHQPFTDALALLCYINPGGHGGVFSTINGLCSTSYKYGTADISYTYNPVPSYSWTIQVVTHELGHGGGAPHDHSSTFCNDACNPNPGFTVCNCGNLAGYNEGTCPAGSVSQHRIMGYCHLVNGILFENGAPNHAWTACSKKYIRNAVNNAVCLLQCDSTAPPTDYCNDNFEPNNTREAAKGLQNKATYSAGLDSVEVNNLPSDDWYKFQNTTTKKNITITCMNFSGTAYLNLQFKISGTWQTVASQQGTGAVTLNYNTTTNIGQYRLQVTSLSGLMVGCYTIRREIKL